ncbi:unnamed protein product [Musa acuminata subsp. burmannicoides]
MDINAADVGKQDGDENKSLQTDKWRNQFPWPIIWIPGDHKSEDAVKDLVERKFDQNVEEKSPSKLKTIPLKLLEDEHCGELLRNKERRTKIIPVRHIEEDMDEKHKIKEKDNSLRIPKKQENGVNKSSDSKQLSQIKTLKLPSIC